MTDLQQLTRDFSADIVSRALRDPEFREWVKSELAKRKKEESQSSEKGE